MESAEHTAAEIAGSMTDEARMRLVVGLALGGRVREVVSTASHTCAVRMEGSTLLVGLHSPDVGAIGQVCIITETDVGPVGRVVHLILAGDA